MADDAVAIQNVKARYCLAVDVAPHDSGGARTALTTIFMPDVVGDYGFQLFHGASELADFLCTAIATSSEWAIHMIHSPRITVDGARATGEWTVDAHLKRREDGQVSR